MTNPLNSNNQHLSKVFIESIQPQAAKNSCWLAALAATLRAACRVCEESHCFNTSELDILNEVLMPGLDRRLNAGELRLLYGRGQNIDTIRSITAQVFQAYLPNYKTTIHSRHAEAPQFEEKFKKDLHKPDCLTMINFEQARLIGKGGGHFSPVAPYNPSLPKYAKPDPAVNLHHEELIPKKPDITIIDPDTDATCIRPEDSSWYDRDYKTVIDAMNTRRPGQTLFRGYVSVCLEEKKR